MSSLKKAVDCGPRHLSLYLLQLADHTPMGREVACQKIVLPGEDTEWQMYYQAINYLREQGFEQYELSNFCRPGSYCRHNLLYWQAYEYLGFGAGAVSYTGGRRYSNISQVELYTADLLAHGRCPQEELESMQGLDIVRDAVILGLRLTGGIELAHFNKRFGIDLLKQFHETISLCINQGLLEIETGRLKLTNQAYFLSNQVFARFMA